MSATKAEYKVRVAFVDTTYWDDGSRWTRQVFTFTEKNLAIAFAREAITKGCKVKGQNGEILARPQKNDVTIERHSVTQVQWGGLRPAAKEKP